MYHVVRLLQESKYVVQHDLCIATQKQALFVWLAFPAAKKLNYHVRLENGNYA